MPETPTVDLTWRDIAEAYPTFVQWVVQRHGGVPVGPVVKEDYERFRDEYLEGTIDDA